MDAAAQAGLAQLMFLAGMAIIIAVLLTRWHRRSSRQTNDLPAAGRTPPRKPDASGVASAPGEAGRWEVHMHDLARDLSGRLDSKIGVLAQLIREADRAASRLEAALASAAGGDDAGPPSAPGAAFGPLQNPTDAVTAADQAEKLKEGVAARAGPPSIGVSAANCRRQRRCEEIYTLSDYGLEAAEIAQRIGSPVGEVELILGLRNTIPPAGPLQQVLDHHEPSDQ